MLGAEGVPLIDGDESINGDVAEKKPRCSKRGKRVVNASVWAAGLVVVVSVILGAFAHQKKLAMQNCVQDYARNTTDAALHCESLARVESDLHVYSRMDEIMNPIVLLALGLAVLSGVVFFCSLPNRTVAAPGSRALNPGYGTATPAKDAERALAEAKDFDALSAAGTGLSYGPEL